MTGAHAPIAPRPWMTDPATTAVMDAVTAGGEKVIIERIPGIREAEVWGAPPTEVRISVDMGKLAERLRRWAALSARRLSF